MRRNQTWSVVDSVIDQEHWYRTLCRNWIPHVLAGILVKRNLSDVEKARSFLYPRIDMLSAVIHTRMTERARIKRRLTFRKRWLFTETMMWTGSAA